MNKQQKIKELTTQYELISNEILQMFILNYKVIHFK